MANVFDLTPDQAQARDGIIATLQQIGEGDLNARVNRCADAVWGPVCEAVDVMAQRLARRERELAQKTRQQIGQSEKLASIGRLAAGVAHEINNPLTGVLTFAHLLRDKPNLDQQDKEDVDLILRETSRAADIVRRLLDFSRERPPTKEALSVNDVIRNTITLVRNQKAFKTVNITENFESDLPKVYGDVNQLQQVLVNLCLNATAAMPDGGDLSLATERVPGAVRIRVTDTGCGIPAENLHRIFDPFFTTKPVGKGTGLGLSVSYGIIEQHGGKIEARSKPGEGTTFTITLPTSDQSSPPTPQFLDFPVE